MTAASDSTRTIRVELGARSYDIVVGPGLLAQTGALLAERLGTHKTVIVSDSNVAPLYAERLAQSLAEAGHQSRTITVVSGQPESSKWW